jgi:hypothetical protein
MGKFAATFLISSALLAQQPAQTQDKKSSYKASVKHLPVARVVLYKSGVGYFEHRGKVRGNQNLTIRFAASQLDDVLKSLTVVDLGTGKITAVRYDSVGLPIERSGPPPLPPDAADWPEQGVRIVTISTAGRGERDIVVSYISEVPVWKTSYRILLSQNSQKATLQGWATVDNMVAQDWANVRLTLATGSPRSFVQRTSMPYYAARPEVMPPAVNVNLPQTHQGTFNLPRDPSRNASIPRAQPVILPPVRNAFAIPDCLRSAPCTAPPLTVPAGPPLLVPRRILAESATPVTDPIEYSLPQPVSIGKGQSALVPIVNAQINAERVTLVAVPEKPLRALWIANTSGVALDGGTFNVVIDNEFAGEGIVKPIKSGERRLLSYGSDPSVTVSSKITPGEEPLTLFKIVRGIVHTSRLAREIRSYTIRNVGLAPREVILEHPARAEWAIASEKPEESTANLHRLRVKVGGRLTKDLVVEETRMIKGEAALASMNVDSIDHLLLESKPSARFEAPLHNVRAMMSAIDAIGRTIQQKDQEIGELLEDMGTLLANAELFRGTPAFERYSGRLVERESHIEKLQADIKDLNAKLKATHEELARFAHGINVD